MKKYFYLLLLCLATNLYAQYWKRIDTVFTPYEIQAISFSSPFLCDIDGDKDLDLFLGSSSLSNILFFRNVGSVQNPKFQREDDLLRELNEKEYHNSASYPVLYDIDGDGDYDLIISTFRGLQLYRNVGDKYFPIFIRIDNFFFEVNKFIGNDAKPSFVDIDDDADLDLFVGIGESLFGGPTPGTILGFRNKGRKTYPKFARDKALTNGLFDIGLNAFPAFVDINDDRKYELVVGRDQNTFAYFINIGSKKNPTWQRTNLFNNSFEARSYWKNPAFVDLDLDGDYDLVYGSADGEIYFYRNVGTRKKPVFKLEQELFTPVRISGGAPSVSFTDFDLDGDYDLISGDYLGTFQYFRNIGNKKTPIFQKARAKFSSINVSSFSTPVFVDINKDGLIDIVSGSLDGKLSCFIQTKNGYTENTSLFKGIKTFEKSAPAFVDIDDDGDLDLLLCGGEPKYCHFYLNENNNRFRRDNSYIKNVTFPYDARPTFADVDYDGDFDLVIGGRDGRLIYYENCGTKVTPVWELNLDLFREIKVKQNASPGFADLDGDGRLELVVGDYQGNFYYYKSLYSKNLVNFYIRAKDKIPQLNEKIDPFTRDYFVKVKVSGGKDVFNPFRPEFVLINLYDFTGNLISTLYYGYLRPGEHSLKLDIGKLNLLSSIYLYTIQISNGDFYSGKIFYYGDGI